MSASSFTDLSTPIALNTTWLDDLGLGALPPDIANQLLADVAKTIEMNVGIRLAEKMSEDQLDEFESFIDHCDEAGAFSYLESNLPDFRSVVAAELGGIHDQLRSDGPRLIAEFVTAVAEEK